jgi:NADH:ubiquinone oxidoreductase subunit F (NADH-binding)
MGGDDVIAEIKASGLRGRGGAGFPTARKWELARASEGDQKYVICNADEGDPGAFMDRSAIEGDPHSVLEGLAIAAYAIGASAGYIYVRAEYPLAVERLQTAIAQANERGLLGEDIFESGFSFNVRIKKGAGAFVCGEETAMMASLEGERGMPRTRPPFPAQKGLYGKPTNINNVETLANVPVILSEGGAAFAANGTEKSPGTKTFALAGKIVRTGLIEVPLGISLREIVYDVGGGIPDDKEFKAVQTGGPSGGCIPADLLDLGVDYEHLADVGAIMGSGGMVVMDNETCMVDVARYFVDFTQKESCGKCVPCRLGTRQMLEMLEGITEGNGAESDVDLLGEIAESIKLGSLCGLGQTAPNPVLTTLKYFADEYAAHVTGGKCPAGVCKALTTFVIDTEACKACGRCVKACPTDAISDGVKKVPAKINQDTCISCGLCRETCPFDAVATA